MEKAMAYNPDKVSPATLAGPATRGQCKALGFHFAKKADGKIDWTKRSRVSACLWSQSEAGKLSYADASDLFGKKRLPQKFSKLITEYLKANG
jgi:hypothetical protein|tara:strand:- start:30 stop:308 length:279 start_codon:yes stop_codon:yes gene_type:complete